MAEREKQAATIEEIRSALRVMGSAADGLREVVSQTTMVMDASIRSGASVPAVYVLTGVQARGRRFLGYFREALNSLTVGDGQGAIPLSKGQPDWEGTVRGGTDTD